MNEYRVVMVPGDGIGPEVSAAVQRILEAAGARIAWIERPAGLAAVERGLEPLPEETVEAMSRLETASTTRRNVHAAAPVPESTGTDTRCGSPLPRCSITRCRRSLGTGVASAPSMRKVTAPRSRGAGMSGGARHTVRASTARGGVSGGGAGTSASTWGSGSGGGGQGRFEVVLRVDLLVEQQSGRARAGH